MLSFTPCSEAASGVHRASASILLPGCEPLPSSGRVRACMRRRPVETHKCTEIRKPGDRDSLPPYYHESRGRFEGFTFTFSRNSLTSIPIIRALTGGVDRKRAAGKRDSVTFGTAFCDTLVPPAYNNNLIKLRIYIYRCAHASHLYRIFLKETRKKSSHVRDTLLLYYVSVIWKYKYLS